MSEIWKWGLDAMQSPELAALSTDTEQFEFKYHKLCVYVNFF